MIASTVSASGCGTAMAAASVCRVEGHVGTVDAHVMSHGPQLPLRQRAWKSLSTHARVRTADVYGAAIKAQVRGQVRGKKEEILTCKTDLQAKIEQADMFWKTGVASAAAICSQALWTCAPALAFGHLILPEEGIPEIPPEEMQAIILVWGGFAFFYLFIAPPTILHWIRIRQKKMKLVETFIAYYFVFACFPGLMLWAPFTNFRPMPRDPSKMPRFDDF